MGCPDHLPQCSIQYSSFNLTSSIIVVAEYVRFSENGGKPTSAKRTFSGSPEFRFTIVIRHCKDAVSLAGDSVFFFDKIITSE